MAGCKIPNGSAGSCVDHALIEIDGQVYVVDPSTGTALASGSLFYVIDNQELGYSCTPTFCSNSSYSNVVGTFGAWPETVNFTFTGSQSYVFLVQIELTTLVDISTSSATLVRANASAIASVGEAGHLSGIRSIVVT